MKIRGVWRTKQIFIDAIELLPDESQKVFNHSPDGFNWGYGGSGPAQLALAICLVGYGDKSKALIAHQDFKWEVVANWPEEDFEDEIDWFQKVED